LILALVAVSLGLITLVGWAARIDQLAAILPGELPMKANAAVLLVLLGVGVILMAEDHRHRLARGLAVAASESRLRTAMDAMVDGVVVSSAIRDEAGRIVDFRFVYANANIGTISGIPADSQIIEHTLLEMFPAHRTNGLFEAYVGVVETGVAFESLDRDLSVAPLSAGGPLDKYVDQHVAKLGDGYVLSVRDVTTRHRAEAEMRRLSTAIEQSADGILIADAEMRITYANAALVAKLGVEPADLVGRAGLEVLDGILEAPALASILEATTSGGPWLGEVDRRLPDGSAGRIQLRLTARLGLGGSVEEFVLNVQDMTELRRAEAKAARRQLALALASREAALAERDRLSREMHDGLAQDLWLAKLKAGRLETMSRRRPEAALLVRQLIDALDSALADSRAAMTTLRSGDDAVPVSLSEVLRDEITDLSDRFGLPIELASGPGLPVLLPLAQAQIVRIVREALMNVLRHADATLARVSLDILDGRLSVTVSDDGRGFDPAGVPSASPGLAGMRERATLIGGSLTIDSRPPAGTSVILRAPIGSPGGAGLEARP
jgi:PAS domain S-box-containing protein